jgi:hypothetical protein
MDYLINNESDSNSEDECKTPYQNSQSMNINKPYISILLTKHGVDKIKTGKDVFDLPLTDLRDPPHISDIYTIGDLFGFMEKNQYIKNAIEYYIMGGQHTKHSRRRRSRNSSRSSNKKTHIVEDDNSIIDEMDY